jgi:DNA-binding LytR/AlgR family response regulator
MAEVRVLIVEDDFSFGLELSMLVEEIGFQVLGMLENSDDALALIKQSTPDVILMDIDIKGSMNGLELAAAIKDFRIPLLFITSIRRIEYYEQARELTAAAFLVKPVEKITLRSSIELTLRNLGRTERVERTPRTIEDAQQEVLFIKRNSTVHRVQISDILFVESFKNYSVIHTSAGKYTLRCTISSMLVKLPLNLFLRIHKSYIVNLSKIERVEISKGRVKLTGFIEIPVGKSYRQYLLEKIILK